MTGRPDPDGVDEAEQRLRLLAALADPDCPWDLGRRPDPMRRVQVDVFFAFAFQRGCVLDGIERRCDQLIASIGGRRELQAPKAPGRTVLPFYAVPLPDAAISVRRGDGDQRSDRAPRP